MPETIGNRKVFTLLEVAGSIEKTLETRYTSSFWVKAEMLRLNHYPRSGHCYPDLVEKSEGNIVAQIRANLWSTTYREINRTFTEITKEPLKDGINILFSARIGYHPVHGLALTILDIDPSYTLGDMEREKQETIKRLQTGEIFDRNKKLPFPLLPKRIAVISVETSKGFADFRNVIDGNPFGYRFFYMLFPSLLQGNNAVKELLEQFRKIKKVREHFDVVAIIRGGGGDVGLSCYDNYDLAKEIALFPLPVLTGIGHSTNETIAQMVAYKNNITPTDLAGFLIQQLHNFRVPLEERERKIMDFAQQLIKMEETTLKEKIRFFISVTRSRTGKTSSELDVLGREIHHQSRIFMNHHKEWLAQLSGQLAEQATTAMFNTFGNLTQKEILFDIHLKNLIDKKKNTLGELEKQVQILDPVRVLKRGFSITRLNGRALSDPAKARKGDLLITELQNGEIKSTVESTKKSK